MFSVSKQLELASTATNRHVVLTGATERSAIARVPKTGDAPSAMVFRRSAGEVSEPTQTPNDAVVLRFFSGRGHLCVHIGSQWHSCGDVADNVVHVSRPNQFVRTEWLSDGEELVLTVPHSYWRERITERMRAMLAAEKPRRNPDPVLQQLASMLMQSAREGMHMAFAAPMIDAMLERIISTCVGKPSTGSGRNALPAFRVERVVRYVREHIAEPITLSDMATAAGMSPMHFAALFRQATGLRPHHYLLEQRILHAKDLMTGTSLPLSDIALSTGFSTQAHFTTVFKRVARTTPRQWRVSRMR